MQGDPKNYSLSRDEEERFWSLADHDIRSGCWIWAGRVSTEGYGVFATRYKGLIQQIFAHRIAHELRFGYGSSRVSCCKRDRLCINPEHLSVTKAAEEASSDPKVQQMRNELKSWMTKHRNQPRKGVRSGADLQGLSR